MVAAAVLRWVWLFLPLTLTHGSSGSFSVEVPGAPLLGLLEGSMTLPCTVSNSLDVRQLEVRWHRPLMFRTPVLLYKNGKYEEGSAEKQFQGRASLLGGLEKGDVSLKLDKLRLTDEGKYICHVSSDNWYDSKNTSLKIQAVGTTPILSVADAGGGEVNVSCQSTCWLPKPSLTWTDKEGRDLNSFSTNRFTKDSEGFTNVSSWLLIPASESKWISCSLSLSAFNQEMRESRVLPHTPTGAESWKGAFIWTLVLLLLCITGVGVYFVLTRKGLIGSKKKKKEDEETEAQPLNSSVEQQQHEDPPADTPNQSEFTAEAQLLNSVEKQQQHEDPPADTPHQSVCTGKLLNSSPVAHDKKQEEPEDAATPNPPASTGKLLNSSPVAHDKKQEGPEDAATPNPPASPAAEAQLLNSKSSVEKLQKQQQHVHPSADTSHQSVFTGKLLNSSPVADGQKQKEPEDTATINPPASPGTDHLPPVNKDQQEQSKPQAALTAPQTALPEGKPLNSSPVADGQKQKEPEGTATPNPPASPGEVEHLKRFKENITIDPEETPKFFKVTGNQNRIRCHRPRNDDEEQYKIFTLCKEKFSSGKHYWEVQVCRKPKEKVSWYVGVASETAERMYKTPLIPKNEFWVLCYVAERGLYITDVPEPPPLPDVSDKLCTVGVFLDCDEHTLSFYNVTTKSHIYTFNNVTAKTPLCPLISPGIRDTHNIKLV